MNPLGERNELEDNMRENHDRKEIEKIKISTNSEVPLEMIECKSFTVKALK